MLACRIQRTQYYTLLVTVVWCGVFWKLIRLRGHDGTLGGSGL